MARPSLILHRRFVVFTKWILLVSAFVIFSALVIWPLIKSSSSSGKNQSLPVVKVEEKQAENSVMEKPHFQGVDQYNRPYNITAEKAVQQGDDNIKLTNIEGSITMEDGGQYKFSADTGLMMVSQKLFDAFGNIVITNTQGYEFLTQSAHMNLEAGTIEGTEEVTIKGPAGILEAKGFSIQEKGNIIDFKGRVRVVVQPKKGKR